MNPEAQRVRHIFVAAVKLPPDCWEAFLREACAGDEELRRQVSDLLQEHRQAGSFLDQPVAHVKATGAFDSPVNGAGAGRGSPDPATAQEGPGTTIGPYKLLERIGEGGMGTVWLAEQREPVHRKVALKIIKAGMDSRQVVARFEAERQALALMDHPHIARVFDGGTTAGGRPYFVMELVKGTPITRYCDEHRLTPHERLELFLPVCQAIQHAHQKGIIHRDVKPANVLVAPYDGRPVPKVIDFGVAKAIGQQLTERTLFTGLGAVVGTLEYMSPEQAELNNQDVDTRSDIYSLGVLLYELLTGTTPLSRERLKQAAFTEVLRAIREEEPPRPSTRLSESKDTLPSISAQRHTEPARLTKLVRGELDWIVMKALEKDRNRRYETANSFAMDVQRYLADEPVLACPPTLGYRLRKLLRRHKGPVVAGGLVLLALVAGIVGTTWGLVRADKAREDAVAAQLAEALRAEGESRAKDEAQKALEAERRAKNAETAQRRRAEDNTKLAMAVLDEVILKEARQRLTFYTQGDAKGLARNPEREKLDREFLEKGLKFYQQLAQTNATDWAARREAAKAYAAVGYIQMNLKNDAAAGTAFRQAVPLMEELGRERPDDFGNAYDLANLYLFRRSYLDSGRSRSAEENFRHALALFDKLAADFPDRQAQTLTQEGRAYCQRNLGVALQKAGKPKEAEKAFRQALASWTKLAAENPHYAGYRNALAYDNGLLGDLFHETGQGSEAMNAWQNASLLLEKVVAGTNNSDSRWQLAGWQERLGRTLRETDQPREAESWYRAALSTWEKLAADTNVPDHRWHLAGCAENLGTLFERTGRLAEAENAYRAALSVWDKLVSECPTVADYRGHCGWCGLRLANLLEKTGRHAEAQEVCRRVRVEWDKMVELAPNLIGFHAIAAWNWVICPEPACRDVGRAIEILQACAKKIPNAGDTWNALGAAYYRAGDWKTAQAALVKGAALRRGGNSFDWFFLAMTRWQLGKKGQAARWYTLALRWMDEHKPTPGVRFGDDQYQYEDLLRIRSEAAALVGLPEQVPSTERPGLADDLEVANLLLEADPSAAVAYQNRGNVYAELGRWDKAVADYAQAVELEPDQVQMWYLCALVRLGAMDTKGYRSTCSTILERFGKSQKPNAAYWVVWPCVLAPDAVADPAALVDLAQKGVARAATNYDYLNTLGAALYRAGRFEEAVQRLGEAATAYKPDTRSGLLLVYNWFFLALAHQRLGQADEARKWLDKAVQWTEQACPEKGKGAAIQVPMPWNRRLTLHLFRREAETLIDGAGKQK